MRKNIGTGFPEPGKRLGLLGKRFMLLFGLGCSCLGVVGRESMFCSHLVSHVARMALNSLCSSG